MGKLRAEMVCVCVVNPNLVKPLALCMESHSSLNLDCEAIHPFYSLNSKPLVRALARNACTVTRMVSL